MNRYQAIGQQIKKARLDQDIGQKVLASALNCACSTISQYENGKRHLLLTDLEKIARTLKRPLSYFILPKAQRFYVSLKEYETLREAKRLKGAKRELQKQKSKIEKQESRIRDLMERIAEQAKIANQTALLYSELKRNEKKARQAEALAAAHKTARDMAYQLNNPLTVLLGYIQLLRANPDHQDPGRLEIMEETAEQCINIISELLSSFEGDRTMSPVCADF